VGGVALLARESEFVQVENAKVVGTNVLSCELVLNDDKRFFVVGCYLAPSDSLGRAQELVEQALWDKPEGTMPLVIGDLNANLDAPRSRREEVLSQLMAGEGLGCATRHFQVRRRRHLRGRWTWRRETAMATRMGERRWIRSRPDYILIGEEERKRVKRCRWVYPPHHTSDHRALITKIRSRGGLKRYRRKRETLPVEPLKVGEGTKLEDMFAALAIAIEKPEKRDRPENSWIRPGTWALVDRRSSKRKQGTLKQGEGRKLGREIKRSLKADRIERAHRAGEEVVLLMADGKVKESWRKARGWYRQSSERAPKPCHRTMEKQTQERTALYAHRNPPGDPIPCNTARPALADEAPTEAEIRAAVKKLKNGRAGGGTKMRA
jgi:hypothetical protein